MGLATPQAPGPAEKTIGEKQPTKTT
jgi:hypothetical protein